MHHTSTHRTSHLTQINIPSAQQVDLAMEFNVKAAYRKSRAPWQRALQVHKTANPYANANTSVENDLLQVPSMPYGSSTAQDPAATARKNNRRLSIHASALAAASGPHRKSFSQANGAPPLPQLSKTMTNNSGAVLFVEEKEENSEEQLYKILGSGTAKEIDDFHKILQQKKAVLTKEIKNNINQNQRYILELTNDLKDTKEELLQLRVTTKELYEILDDFKEAAERRIELEHEVPAPSASSNSTISAASSKGLLVLSRRKDRSSIMVLEKMWKNELRSLFKHVEGASKFIQPLPGRHVLTESGRWHEINVGNWKPTKTVHIVVLNDLILIATKKTSAMQEGSSTKTRLQATHCWPLNEVSMTEVSKPSSHRGEKDDKKVYLVNVKAKSLSYVFQTDRFDHFKKIIEAHNKGKKELLQRDRVLDSRRSIDLDGEVDHDEEKRQLRDSFKNYESAESIDEKTKRRSSQRQSMDVVLQDISSRVHSRNRSLDFNKIHNKDTEKIQYFNELKKIEDKLDEIDIEVAHNKYTESVGLIRHIEQKLVSVENSINSKTNAEAKASADELRLLIDVIKIKIDNRKVKVQRCLAFDLNHNISRLGQNDIGQIIEFFASFDELDQGVNLYLQAMSSYLSTNVSRSIVGVQGSTKLDIVNYLSNLVIIYSSVLKRVVTNYEQSIVPIIRKDKQGKVDSSIVIDWCIEEVSRLVDIVKKHLYGNLLAHEKTDLETEEKIYKVKDTELFDKFLGVLQPQLSQLKDVGVNIDFLFDDVLECIER